MRSDRLVAATALVTMALLVAQVEAADQQFSPLELALACAPPPFAYAPTAALHVLGGQDPVPRTLFSQPDLLVIDAGTGNGVRLGQQYFARRPAVLGSGYLSAGAQSGHTAGWIRIVAADETTALATVEYTCDAVEQGDYLEPFVPPLLPPGVDRDDTSGRTDFTSAGRVLSGDRQRVSAGGGDFMLIDRGANQGVTPGDRFAIYRDPRARSAMYVQSPKGRPQPLAGVGEAIAVTTGPMLSLVRITTARDAVLSGDIIVPRRK